MLLHVVADLVPSQTWSNPRERLYDLVPERNLLGRDRHSWHSCIIHKLCDGYHGSHPCFLCSLCCSMRQHYQGFVGCRILCLALAYFSIAALSLSSQKCDRKNRWRKRIHVRRNLHCLIHDVITQTVCALFFCIFSWFQPWRNFGFESGACTSVVKNETAHRNKVNEALKRKVWISHFLVILLFEQELSFSLKCVVIL